MVKGLHRLCRLLHALPFVRDIATMLAFKLQEREMIREAFKRVTRQ